MKLRRVVPIATYCWRNRRVRGRIHRLLVSANEYAYRWEEGADGADEHREVKDGKSALVGEDKDNQVGGDRRESKTTVAGTALPVGSTACAAQALNSSPYLEEQIHPCSLSTEPFPSLPRVHAFAILTSSPRPHLVES